MTALDVASVNVHPEVHIMCDKCVILLAEGHES